MDTRKFGTGMIAAACILGMFVLTWMFSDVEQDRRNPNRDPESVILQNAVEVNLQRNRQGHYLVVGQINNRPVEFLLDTGATDVVIPQRLAHNLGLRPGRQSSAMTANGPVTVFETNIDQLSIGGIELYNVRASINPAMNNMSILLGMSALGRLDFVQQGDSLTLRQKSL